MENDPFSTPPTTEIQNQPLQGLPAPDHLDHDEWMKIISGAPTEDSTLETSNQYDDYWSLLDEGTLYEEADAAPEEADAALMDEVVRATKVAYHGLRAAVATKRMERAGDTMERMDHKESLYAHLGASTVGSAADLSAVKREYHDTIHENPKTRSRSERFKDKRLEKRQHKKDYKQASRNRVIKAFGGEESSTVGVVGNRVVGVARRRGVNSAYKNGDLSAREVREAKFDIKANPVSFENSEQKKSRAKLSRSNLRLNLEARQPILSRWRRARKSRAVNRIKNQHRKSEEHRAAVESLSTDD